MPIDDHGGHGRSGLGITYLLDSAPQRRPHITGRLAKDLPIDKLKVPAGFKVEVWTDGIPEARSLALGDKGTVFVSNRTLSNVYAVVDPGGKRTVKTLLKGMTNPNGITFSKGTLYVAERNRTLSYAGIEDRLDNPPEPAVVIDNLDPNKAPGHFWKFLAMGPDGKLCFNIGNPQNISMPSYNEATIMQVDVKTGVLENFASGVRFYTGNMFPPEYHNNMFMARRGSWNREIKHGYDVLRVVIDAKNNARIEPFLTGFLIDEKADPPMWGRPVDVLVIRDGSLLVSDDHNGIIYRVSHAARPVSQKE
ncbi:MAG: PQQ-dependent sugar dehydrogenase [Burkholderiales bacterium]